MGNLVTWGGDQPCGRRVSLALGAGPKGTWRPAAHSARPQGGWSRAEEEKAAL